MTSTLFSSITLDINPMIEVGPLTLSWHGLTIAIGILIAGALAVRFGKELGLDPDEMVTVALIMGVAGFIGSRLFYLAVNEPLSLLNPLDWVGTRGFAIYGAVILGPLASLIFLRRRKLSLRYLDALAAGFPLGLAIGRIGDVINGEHHGPPTDAPWGIIRTSLGADVPSPTIAYHDGGLYEVALGLILFALIWPLRHRFQRQLTLLWTVVGLYSVGRFLMFFYRVDSEPVIAGLYEAQLVSLGLLLISGLGLVAARHGPKGPVDSAGTASV